MSHAAAEACAQRLAAGRGTGIGLQHVNDDESTQRDKPLHGSRGKTPSNRLSTVIRIADAVRAVLWLITVLCP